MSRNPNRFLEFVWGLVPAFLFFMALDNLLGIHYFSRYNVPAFDYLLVPVGAFALEQFLTMMSTWVFRGFLLGLVLRYPSENLFRQGPRGVLAMIFPEYFAAMPTEIAIRLNKKFSDEGVNGLEARFLHAWTRVQGESELAARLNTLAAEGLFAQNMAFTSLVSLIFAAAAKDFSFSAFALAGSIVFSYRFLKIMRQHALEMYLGYDGVTGAAAAGTASERRRDLKVAGRK